MNQQASLPKNQPDISTADRPLSEIGCFVKFTQQKGVLRCHEDPEFAHGVHFQCPRCGYDEQGNPKHSLTLLFNHPAVPATAQPYGRYTAMGSADKNPQIENLSVLEIIRAPCGFRGIIRNGRVSPSHE